MRRAKRTMDELKASRTCEAELQTANAEQDAPIDACAGTGRLSGRNVFWRVYAIVLAAFCVLLLAAILVTQSALADYESARPNYVAERVFEEYFEEEDSAALLEKADFSLSEVEDAEDFARFWKEQTQGDVTFVRVSADNGGESVRYNVRSGDKTFAAFELALSQEKTTWGNPLYELSKIELGIGAKHKARVSAPSGSTVFVNGVKLSEKYVVSADETTESCAHMPEGVSGITYDTYEVKGLLFEAEISVQNANGQEHKLVFDKAIQAHRAVIVYDEELREEMSDFVIQAAQTYAASMQNDRPKSQALSYIEPNTMLYDQTINVSTAWVSAHSGYRFENVKASEFYAYDENTFSCRVSFVHVLTGGTTRFDENGENREKVDITWYYRKVGDKYLIYDRENN